MLTDEQLYNRFVGEESDLVERKEGLSDNDRIRQAICAFANDLPAHNLPGTIFIGQKDNGECSGIVIDDRLLLSLSQMRDDGKIQPIPSMSVSKKTFDGCDVAVVEVTPSQNPPVKVDGRVWIRVGPRRALATGQEERQLLDKRQWGNLPFDAQPCNGSTQGDLDLARFQIEFLPSVVPVDVLEQNQRSTEQQLKSLRLLSATNTPTNSGILLLGKSPESWLPGAYVQFRRIAGTRLTDATVDSHAISGTLLDQIRRLDELLILNIRVGSRVGGELREEHADYPIEALRQLARNALIHRIYDGTSSPVRITWYTDRIEIQSPGGPYGQVTVDNFGHGATDYRNPSIAGLMVQMRIMERFGIGIQIARDRLAENGNPDLEFDVNQQHVLAIVRLRQ